MGVLVDAGSERVRHLGPGDPTRIFDGLPDEIDLRDGIEQERLLATADALLERSSDPQDLAQLECLLADRPEDWPLIARLSVKLARSKALLRERWGPLHLSVVVPLYAEHQRMLSPLEHALGEDLLGRKLRELEWLFAGDRRRTYELLVVDDGCPHGSGEVAEARLETLHPGAPARVLYLSKAIETSLPVVRSIGSVDESHKGGSVHYGLYEASREVRAGHVVLYTDADLSTNLGQAGLLIDALDRGDCLIAAGSRRDPRSVVVKGSTRSARGRLFIYLWKQLLPLISYVDDTQCGFKALTASTARGLLQGECTLAERGFAFDIELLLHAELLKRRATARIPVGWIDSEAASTTKALEPYLPMLRSALSLSRRHLESSPARDAFARAIDHFDESSWQRAIDELGPGLEEVDPALDRLVAHLPASALEHIAA